MEPVKALYGRRGVRSLDEKEAVLDYTKKLKEE